MIARLTYAVVAVLALAAAVWWVRADAYRDGQRAERAVWVKRQADAERAQLESNKRERARYDQIVTNYRTALGRIADDRQSLARRLRDLPRPAQPGACPGQPADPAPEPGGEAGIDAAFDEYDRACREDAEQLRALIDAVAPATPTR